MNRVVILSACRTPIGSFSKSLSKVTATQLGTTAIRAAIDRAGLVPDKIEEVFMGNVLSANLGQSPAVFHKLIYSDKLL
jgi:acetyl-CoA C-acetyltransferase